MRDFLLPGECAVVFKDGSYVICKKEDAWEYQADFDWLVTIYAATGSSHD